MKSPDDQANPPAQSSLQAAPKLTREQRLARALRDNLRRRKTGSEGPKTDD